ncbi:phage tail protein [Streptomyces sp. NPDC051563]|uniref:phage tail protein n=1 Tax=Streptomyces sp. NPDC051563 TaxID=3365659 RepID=UPI00378B56E1
MADSIEIVANYPVPGFRFTVDFDGDGVVDMRCNGVSGLDQQYESFEYRDGMGGLFKGLTRVQLPTITFNQAVLPADSSFFSWINGYGNSGDGKKDITINLTDESGEVLYVTWHVFNAFPTGVNGVSLDAASNEVTIKELSMNGDRLTVEAHSA